MDKTLEEQVAELKAYFKDTVLPQQINLAPGVKIINTRQFLDNQFNILNSDNGLVMRRPALDRLILLKSLMENEQ